MPRSAHCGAPATIESRKRRSFSSNPLLDFAHEALTNREQRLQWYRLGGHALEGVIEVVPDVTQRRKQHLVHRPVAAGQVDHEGAPDAGRDALVSKELHHVEQIARMLPVQRRDQLAAVHVLQRDDRNLRIRRQHVARGRRERGPSHRPHSASHHDVHLDLHLHGTAAHEQLGLTLCSRRRMHLQASLLQALGCLPDGLVDASQRGVPRHRVIGKDQIEVHRQARHVAHEQVDRGATLERE